MNVIEYFPNKRTMEDTVDNTNVSRVKIFPLSAFNLQLTLLALIEVDMPTMLLGNIVFTIKMINKFASGLRRAIKKL